MENKSCHYCEKGISVCPYCESNELEKIRLEYRCLKCNKRFYYEIQSKQPIPAPSIPPSQELVSVFDMQPKEEIMGKIPMSKEQELLLEIASWCIELEQIFDKSVECGYGNTHTANIKKLVREILKAEIAAGESDTPELDKAIEKLNKQ